MGLALMLDVEQRYTRDQALMAAKRLERLGLTWFEAPLPAPVTRARRSWSEKTSDTPPSSQEPCPALLHG
jgi:L-alanine-DL-glutamate epimerase-like enolase superfamily enzyme